jgi:hypothetical protein
MHAYLSHVITDIQNQRMGAASLMKEISEKSASVIGPTRCINEAILCSENHDIHHMSEEILNI